MADGAEVVIYEAALIVEKQLHKGMSGLIVVSLPADVQRRRLMARDGIDESAADARIGAQLPLADKLGGRRLRDRQLGYAGTSADAGRRGLAGYCRSVVEP